MRQYIRHPADIPIEINNVAAPLQATQNLVNVSLGGLSFHSKDSHELGKLLKIRIPIVDPEFQTTAQVVWCKPIDGQFEIGVKLLDRNDAYRTRMVEQVCHIEHYKRQIYAEEGRRLSGPQAAQEWIQKFAKSFPKIHEAETI